MEGELRKLTRLAVPVASAQVGTMLMGVVDTVMVGRVGVEALAAAAIANAWIYGILLFGQGLLHGLDPLVTQAHGANRGDLAGLALQRGAALAVVISIPLGALWLMTEEVLLAAGQLPEIARAAHRYTVVQIGSMPFFFGFMALRQYLQGREHVRPSMWVTIFANVFNAVANYALIFGKLGAPELGLYGAGIATASTRVLMFAALLAFTWGFRLHAGAWVPWKISSTSPRALMAMVAIGFPIAIQMSLEVWAFSAAALLAGRLGAVDVAAHTIALNMAALSFMMPLGVSQAAVTRIGNLLGAGEPDRAQHAAWVAVGVGAGVMSVSAIAFVALRHQIPRIYTADESVIALCATILPIAAAFQLFDGVQVVGSGVLRGMGRTRPAAVFNFVGYWILGLPIGAWLAFEASWGLRGLWWGLCLGLAVVAVSLVIWIRYRGPAHASAEFVESSAL